MVESVKNVDLMELSEVDEVSEVPHFVPVLQGVEVQGTMTALIMRQLRTFV